MKSKEMSRNPTTTAHLRVHSQSFSNKSLAGEVSAGDFQWNFIWKFSKGELLVNPPLGRALIEDALLKFLLQTDYSLEPGGDYIFTVRAKF